MQIADIFKDYESLLDTQITTNGWVKTCRNQKQMIFISLSDGSSQKILQVIALPEFITNMEELSAISTGTSLCVKGKLVKSPAKGQLFELVANEVKIYQICQNDFPFQKVGLPLEFMRNYPHLRHRSNIMRAVFTIRSVVIKSIHDFFTDNNFHLVDLPVLTTNACEGGCKPLQVTSLIDSGKISDIPAKYIRGSGPLDMHIKTNDIDFEKDFFGNPVYLTVSNQLHLECFAHGMGRVYTITPATRGEPSVTTKHLAHFSMLEIEFCFGELSDNIDFAEGCIKYCTDRVMKQCKEELLVMNIASEGLLLPKLNKIVSEPFIRIEHFDAIKLLKEVHNNKPFTEEPMFDGDLTGEHERFLVAHFGQPVAVMRYPKAVKAFYMPVHHSVEIDGKTIEYVDCFDLLTDIGETVGGSQRIWDEATLVERMVELGIDPKHLDWYVQLRKYGSVPHGGFGLGIERLIATITGMNNVKDCLAFPITIHHCAY